MFKNAKIGDKVWHFVYGWGVIKDISINFTYPLYAVFNNGKGGWYTLSGKFDKTEQRPSIFWDEVKFEIPKKPFNLEREYRKLERKEFDSDASNWTIYFNYDSDCWKAGCNSVFSAIGAQWFMRDTTWFIDLLNEHNVTPQQLNEVIRKVERDDEE